MRLTQIITISLIVALLGLPFGHAIAQTINPDNFIFIESRFRLWDENEKMIDNNFNIIIINTELNKTVYYEIQINADIMTGVFSRNITIPIYTNETMIALSIRLDNHTALSVSGISIIGNVNYQQITSIQHDNLISLNPLTWSKKERNIFYSVIVAGLISVLISYLSVMRYRKLKGVMEIK